MYKILKVILQVVEGIQNKDQETFIHNVNKGLKENKKLRSGVFDEIINSRWRK